MNNLGLYTILLLGAILIEVSILALPLGLLLILIWYVKNGPKQIIFLLLIFSLVLSAIFNVPVWAVLATTAASFLLFLLAETVLPQKPVITFGVFVAALVFWEFSTGLILNFI
ncbi:MAG: hypothetical protein WD187_00270 [Candidatus Woykebacteria bacterium]